MTAKSRFVSAFPVAPTAASLWMPSVSTACRLDEAWLICSCNCVSVLATARAMRWWFKSTLSCANRRAGKIRARNVFAWYANKALVSCLLEGQHPIYDMLCLRPLLSKNRFALKLLIFPDFRFLFFFSSLNFLCVFLNEECTVSVSDFLLSANFPDAGHSYARKSRSTAVQHAVKGLCSMLQLSRGGFELPSFLVSGGRVPATKKTHAKFNNINSFRSPCGRG